MFKIIDEKCTPNRGSKYSSSVDLCSRVDAVIGAGETKVIPLGVKIDLDKVKLMLAKHKDFLEEDTLKGIIEDFLLSHFLELKIRSSLAKKLIIPNGVGEIDIDYPDEIGLMVHNPLLSKQYVQNGENYTVLEDDDDNEYKIKAGERVAQIKLMEHKSYLMGYETDIERNGGFGSTRKS